MKPPQQNRYGASSVEYWTELTPDPASLTLFLVVALVTAVTGTSLLLSSGLATGWLASVVCAWLLFCGHGVWRHVQARIQINSVRILAGGAVCIALRRGDWLQGRLQPGTLALPSVAWLRLRTDDRRSMNLLFLASQQNANQWRRFQVIYRQTGSHS